MQTFGTSQNKIQAISYEFPVREASEVGYFYFVFDGLIIPNNMIEKLIML